MADRYQDRPFPADAYNRGGDQRGAGRGDGDPLAELARLIGQTDQLGAGRANPQPMPPPIPRNPPPQHQPPQYQQPAPQYHEEPEFEDERPAGRPPWIQRANQREIHREPVSRDVSRQALPEPEYAPEPVHPVHPLHRYAAQPGYAPQTVADHDHGYQHEEALPEEGEGHELDPSRYDEALYGQLETADQDFQRDPAYPDDPYAYQDGYEDEVDEGSGRRGGFLKVAAVLALAVLGTGAAFAYHSFFTSPRSGDVPIIRADNTPTKIVPAPADVGTKVPDRMVSGDAAEKIVPREETPIDVNANAGGPRVVFPQLNPNGNPPSASSVSTSTLAAAPNAGAASTNGTLPAGEPRKVRTLTVRGDQPDAAAAPVNAPSPAPQVAAKPAKGTPRNPPTSANASANAPMSLSAQDQAPEPRTRVAATNPAQTAPAAAGAGAASGGYLVSVSSQQSEGDAENSYRMLQSKFPTQLGSRSPVIKRTELGEKVVYRAMVGPFGTSDEAKQFCVDYKAAGGQCFVPKN
jgi:sporulation related protein